MQSRSPEEVLKIVEQDRRSFNHIHVSASFSRLGKLVRSQRQRSDLERDGRFHRLLELAQSLLGSKDVRELANTVYGLCKLRVRKTGGVLSLLANIGDKMAHCSKEPNPQDIANTAWSFATLGVSNESLFDC